MTRPRRPMARPPLTEAARFMIVASFGRIRPLSGHDHEKAWAGAAVALGLPTVAWPLPWAPPWTYLVASLGAVAALAAAFLRWRSGPALVAAAAILSCAFSHVGVAVLAAESLFILAYLLAADAPPALTQPARWLRRQAVLVVAGLIATGAVLAAYAVHSAASAWLTAAALTAAVVAYLIALPRAAASAPPAVAAATPEHTDQAPPAQTGTA
jgi:hypothetical protein